MLEAQSFLETILGISERLSNEMPLAGLVENEIVAGIPLKHHARMIFLPLVEKVSLLSRCAVHANKLYSLREANEMS